MWKDRIKAAHTAPPTAEDRVRLRAYLTVGTTVVVNQSDLREVLSTLDALRKSYTERGEAIETLMRERT